MNDEVASGCRKLFEQLVAVCLELHEPINDPVLETPG
jgi:hypothetical protein